MFVCVYKLFESNWFLIAVSTYSGFFLAKRMYNYGLAKSILKCKRKCVGIIISHIDGRNGDGDGNGDDSNNDDNHINV